jgi:hypothetical protein
MAKDQREDVLESFHEERIATANETADFVHYY